MECSKKLDMIVVFSVSVSSITLTWISVYIYFSITYVKVRPLQKITISCWTDSETKTSVLSK